MGTVSSLDKMVTERGARVFYRRVWSDLGASATS